MQSSVRSTHVAHKHASCIKDSTDGKTLILKTVQECFIVYTNISYLL